MPSVLQLHSEKQIVVLKLEILEAYSMNNLCSVFKLIRLASQSELPLCKVQERRTYAQLCVSGLE